MIVTDLQHIGHQVSITTAFEKAIDFLRRTDIHSLVDGRVEIDGEQIYAIVQRYETVITDTPRLEYHKKYIDIQYVVSGEELIGWAPAEELTITEAYDSDKDVCFGTVPEDKMTRVCMQAGQVMVLYPEDGHAPKLVAGAPSSVFKIVIKVAATS